MTTRQTLPSDHAARQAIVECLDVNMVVEAGAGTGKTTSLIGRVLALVTTGHAHMGQIAAITFTDAAAAELRERIRESLEDAVDSPDLQPEERSRCESAVRDLDRASVQTLHSFARSILTERPLEAGLPPGFQPRDEIQADIAFDEQWNEWIDSTLDDPQAQEVLRPALEMGLQLGHMRQIAVAFHKDYDLIADASFDTSSMPPSPAEPLLAARHELERLSAFSKSDDDVLLAHVRVVLALATQVEHADASEAYRLLESSPKIKFGKGRQADWNTDPDTGRNACAAIKALLKDIDDEVRDNLERTRDGVLVPVLDLLREFVLEYAAKRKTDGVADFHDLLVCARDLLRDNIEVRDYFRERYSHIFIDEVQDTDPIQAEIAMFLAEDAPPGEPSARPRGWRKVSPTPGKLFVVGDPKQSIYRFRRADIEQVKQLHDRVGGRRENLTQNFRSLRPIIAWVNRVFGQWIAEGDGQPDYIPLQAERSGGDPHPPVQYIGEEHEGIVGQVRDEEARAISKVIHTALRDGWEVRPEHGGEPKPVAARDICILMRTRSGLSMLEFALDAAGIPYRIEGAAPVYETQEVRDLLNCLSAIDDPTDDVSVVAALRSPAFACSDVDLLKFVESDGQFDYLSEGEFPPGVVSDSLCVLRKFHERRAWIAPSRLIEEFVRCRKLMELAMSQRRPRERWRHYRFLIDRARAFASSGEPSLRAFVAWAERQRTEGARMVESPIPEADEDAVRVMTMHAAKGLEFPIVILTGLNSAPSHRPNAVLFDRSNQSVEVRVGSKDSAFRTPGYQALSDLEKLREEEEEARLLYVAATRAKDHLVVSMYRPAKADDNSLAARIAGYLEDTCQSLPVDDTVDDAADDDTPLSRARWQEQREDAYARSARRPSVAATTLAKELKQEQDTPDEPWRRGRAGTRIGKAVHAVLQMVDLETGDGLDDIAKEQANAEGIPGRVGEISRLARIALDSDLVGRAIRSGRWWREVPVAAPIGRGIVEGFIDLLFQEEDGFVIVDYKTDALRSDDDIQKAMRRYELQGGGYALALTEATGVYVKEVSFLFLNSNRVEPIGDLGEAVRRAKSEALLSLSDDAPHDDAGRPRSAAR